MTDHSVTSPFQKEDLKEGASRFFPSPGAHFTSRIHCPVSLYFPFFS